MRRPKFKSGDNVRTKSGSKSGEYTGVVIYVKENVGAFTYRVAWDERTRKENPHAPRNSMLTETNIELNEDN